MAVGAVEAEDVGLDPVGHVAVERAEHRPFDPHPVVVWLFGVVWLFWLRVLLLYGFLILGIAPRTG